MVRMEIEATDGLEYEGSSRTEQCRMAMEGSSSTEVCRMYMESSSSTELCRIDMEGSSSTEPCRIVGVRSRQAVAAMYSADWMWKTAVGRTVQDGYRRQQ